jgi:hypothetical protein
MKHPPKVSTDGKKRPQPVTTAPVLMTASPSPDFQETVILVSKTIL